MSFGRLLKGRLCDLRGQIGAAEGLVKHQVTIRQPLRIGISRHEQDPEIGPDFPHLVGEVGSRHAGHGEVGDQDIELVVCLQDVEGGRSIGRSTTRYPISVR